MQVDAATSEDTDAVVRLLVAQLREHDIGTPEPAVRLAVDGALADPARARILVARDGPVVGVAYVSFVWSLEHGGRAAWLEELYVAPDRRGAGIGGRLLEAVVALGRREGWRAVDLEVEASHARVMGLYQRLGFERHDRTRFVKRL